MKRNRQPKTLLKGVTVRRINRQTLRDLQRIGDQLTGGGLRSLVKRQLNRLRDVGNRLTGGGLRSLGKRVLATLFRRAMKVGYVKVVGRAILQPFPALSARLYRLSRTYRPTAAADRHFISSLYTTAFGRPPDERELNNWVSDLETKPDRSVAAEHFVQSVEFQNRHGPSREIHINYVTDLYRNGLGRPPKLEELAFWLAEGEKGASRASVLIGVAGLDEALQRVLLSEPRSETEYARWIAAYDTISDADRAVIRAHIATLPLRPLISVIMPIDNASDVALRRSLNSVVTQLYPCWELCIAVDPVAEAFARGIAYSCAAGDTRITFVQSGSLLGTEGPTNVALAHANGEFVTFIRPGDTLPEHALYEVLVAILGKSSVDVLYSDHDEIGTSGIRSNPWFKPGWDQDLLLGHDYVSPLTVYRYSLLKEVGFLRSKLEGAEFYDLALRATGATTPDRICHIPAILYHKGSSNHNNESETRLRENSIGAARQAVRNFLDSQGNRDAAIETASLMPTANRVIWPMPETLPLVSVIVPTRDRAELLDQCVEGVLNRTDYMNLEVLIIDNGSAEPATMELFDRLVSVDKRVRILRRPEPFNYSALNNAAAREANGEILLLLNNDTSVIQPDWLHELVSQAIRPDVGIVGAKLLYGNQKVQHGGIALGPHGHAAHVHRLAERNDPGYFGQLALARTLSAVTAACSAIRRAVFFEVGGFDSVNLAVNFNDVDLCLRLGDYGYRVVWTPFAELFHLESASRGKEDMNPATRERFLREWSYLRKTWGTLLEFDDPFHNPNLLFHPDYFEIPSLPRREKPWQTVFGQFFGLKRYFFPGAMSDRRDAINAK